MSHNPKERLGIGPHLAGTYTLRQMADYCGAQAAFAQLRKNARAAAPPGETTTIYDDFWWQGVMDFVRHELLRLANSNELEDAIMERDYYKNMLLTHAANLKPVSKFLQWDTKKNPTPPADQGERSNLFGHIDMFALLVRGLPDAAALRRAKKFEELHAKRASAEKVQE